jgi:hypothetical protein
MRRKTEELVTHHWSSIVSWLWECAQTYEKLDTQSPSVPEINEGVALSRDRFLSNVQAFLCVFSDKIFDRDLANMRHMKALTTHIWLWSTDVPTWETFQPMTEIFQFIVSDPADIPTNVLVNGIFCLLRSLQDIDTFGSTPLSIFARLTASLPQDVLLSLVKEGFLSLFCYVVFRHMSKQVQRKEFQNSGNKFFEAFGDAFCLINTLLFIDISFIPAESGNYLIPCIWRFLKHSSKFFVPRRARSECEAVIRYLTGSTIFIHSLCHIQKDVLGYARFSLSFDHEEDGIWLAWRELCQAVADRRTVRRLVLKLEGPFCRGPNVS